MEAARSAWPRHAAGLPLAVALLIVVGLLSLRYGVLHIDFATVWDSIWNYNRSDPGQVVVRELRVPRTIIGMLAGAGFAVAGALIQGVTRNPLGAPGILGTNAGAAFAVVVAIYGAGITSPAGYVWFAFAGALGATVLVYLVASAGAGGPTPVTLTLAGAVVAALLGSWTAALVLIDSQTLTQARFWLAGSISGGGTEEVVLLLPIIAVALVVALSMGRQLNAMSLGEEVATGLGQRTGLVRAVAGVCVIALAGSAVAMAGPVVFVGLVVPHIVRSVVGSDYRWIILYSALLGPCMLLGVDIVGRLIITPSELQAGIISAAVGAPFLIYLVRGTKLAEL